MPAGNPNYPWRPAPKYSTWPAGDPRRRLIRRASDQSAVLPPPIVVTVGVNAITETSANVIGSINPQGLSGTTWWFTYGTTLPLPSATTTAVTALTGSPTATTTITATLTGLTTGVTYYLAAVGRNAAGTVLGETFPFVSSPSPSFVTPPFVPFGQPSVTIPHFQVPVAFSAQGGMSVVEQDTVEEVASNVTAVVLCQVGACPQLPSFGRPDVAFAQEPINTSALTTAIQQLEPRANEDVLTALRPDGQTWGITLTTSTTGAEGV